VIARKPDALGLIRSATVEPTPADLPPDWHLLWDERAAIMEHDGRLPRERAEAEALTDILRRMREAGVAPLRVKTPSARGGASRGGLL